MNWTVRVIVVAVVLAIGWALAKLAERGVRNGATRAGMDPLVLGFVAGLVRWLIVTLVVLSCLGVVGIRTTSFAAVLGAAGLAIGLALQGTLANLASGVLLLTLRPFKVGDFVRAGGENGTVTDLGLFTTQLDTPDNRRIIVPNKSVAGGNIENVTFHERHRADVNVGVAYDASVGQTREVLVAAAAGIEGALEDPAPKVVLVDLGDSAVLWQVRVWAPTPDYAAVRERVVAAVKAGLDEAGIAIPFPQIDVHLDQAS